MNESNEAVPENSNNPTTVPQSDETQSQLDITYMEAVWRGPLPPPEVVQRYEDMVPGAADRLLTLTEKQQAHSHNIEEKVINIHQTVVGGDSRRSDIGLWLGFVVAVLGILCGTYLGLRGHEWLGAVIAGVPLTYLVGAFIYGSKSRRDERNRNAEAAPE